MMWLAIALPFICIVAFAIAMVGVNGGRWG